MCPRMPSPWLAAAALSNEGGCVLPCRSRRRQALSGAAVGAHQPNLSMAHGSADKGVFRRQSALWGGLVMGSSWRVLKTQILQVRLKTLPWRAAGAGSWDCHDIPRNYARVIVRAVGRQGSVCRLPRELSARQHTWRGRAKACRPESAGAPQADCAGKGPEVLLAVASGGLNRISAALKRRRPLVLMRHRHRAADRALVCQTPKKCVGLPSERRSRRARLCSAPYVRPPGEAPATVPMR